MFSQSMPESRSMKWARLELGASAEIGVGRWQHHSDARHRQELAALLEHAAAIERGGRSVLGANHCVAALSVGLEPGVELRRACGYNQWSM